MALGFNSEILNEDEEYSSVITINGRDYVRGVDYDYDEDYFVDDVPSLIDEYDGEDVAF